MRRATRIVLAAVIAVAGVTTQPSPARADLGPLQLAWAQYEASYVHRGRADGDPPAADEGLGLAGLRIRVLLGTDDSLARRHRVPIYLAVGLDLAAGLSRGPGFAYDVALHPVGLGLRLGGSGGLVVSGGIGASGATGSLDDAVVLPIEAGLQLSLGARLRLIARGRLAWLGAADDRQRGAPSLGWTDELDASLALRVGRRYRCSFCWSGNGTFVGAAYREAEGARYLGIVLGHAIDIGADHDPPYSVTEPRRVYTSR